MNVAELSHRWRNNADRLHGLGPHMQGVRTAYLQCAKELVEAIEGLPQISPVYVQDKRKKELIDRYKVALEVAKQIQLETTGPDRPGMTGESFDKCVGLIFIELGRAK